MRSLFALILGVFMLVGVAFAMDKSGDTASVLMEASKALEASNPELAAKVKAIADDLEAPKSEHPVAKSEHPSEHPA